MKKEKRRKTKMIQ